jgi:hypothetical protein
MTVPGQLKPFQVEDYEGSIMCEGVLRPSTSAVAAATWQMLNTAAIAITTTGALAVDLTALWAGAGNSFICTNLILTSMN